MAFSRIKTRILIISDTHCATLDDAKEAKAFQHPLPSADVLIHCGDLTYEGTMEQYNQAMDMLERIDAPVKLVIAGNHDLSLDREFVIGHRKQEYLEVEEAESRWKEARDFWTAAEGRAKMAGVIFLDEGVHDIKLPNGASIRLYTSPYTPEFYDWGFPYRRNEDRFNPPNSSLADAENIAINPIPSHSGSDTDIDVLLTHGPPVALLGTTSRGDDAGCPHLLRALLRSRPMIHMYGHIHEGWGAELVTWSPGAESTAAKSCTTQEWTDGAWRHSVIKNDAQTLNVDLSKATREHAAFLDISRDGKDLERGKQTLMVNAAIMDVHYKPVNAPWIVDVDLPKA